MGKRGSIADAIRSAVSPVVRARPWWQRIPPEVLDRVQKLGARYRDQGLAVAGINVESTRPTGEEMAQARAQARRLFAQARKLSGETDYVVLGSLAALGYAGQVPARMAISLDVDAYGKSDPGRIFELAAALGQGSPFEAEHGYYLDPISPHVATLPAGWGERLVRIELEPALAAWFLEPNDMPSQTIAAR